MLDLKAMVSELSDPHGWLLFGGLVLIVLKVRTTYQ